MLKDEIYELQQKLNKDIEENKDYETISETSKKIDELINQYYKEKNKK